jgi:polyferredoxin
MDKLDIVHLQLFLLIYILIKIGYQLNLYDTALYFTFVIADLGILFLSLWSNKKD